jgi:hypothetical protein
MVNHVSMSSIRRALFSLPAFGGVGMLTAGNPHTGHKMNKDTKGWGDD